MSLFSPLEKLAYHLSGKSRARKWEQFLQLMEPQATDKILDVGVNTTEYSDGDNYLEKHYAHPENITALGVGEDFALFRERYPLVTVVSGDGKKLPFPDNTFQISYSNAVIEHVGPYAAQLAFLSEMYRVSARGYLTTPNRLFPIEVHTRVPLLHLFLPKTLFDRFLHLIGKGWAAGDYMHLLSRTDLESLFNKAGIAATITPNRLFGLTLTYTVTWKKV